MLRYLYIAQDGKIFNGLMNHSYDESLVSVLTSLLDIQINQSKESIKPPATGEAIEISKKDKSEINVLEWAVG